MNSLLNLFGIALVLSVVGCTPDTHVTTALKMAPAKAPATHFVFSASPNIENLTLEDYAALNRDMDGLLRRSGFTSGKGYLIPTLHFHGGTYPTLNVEGDSDPGVELGSNEATKATLERFTLECEKILRRTQKLKEPNSERSAAP